MIDLNILYDNLNKGLAYPKFCSLEDEKKDIHSKDDLREIMLRIGRNVGQFHYQFHYVKNEFDHVQKDNKQLKMFFDTPNRENQFELIRAEIELFKIDCNRILNSQSDLEEIKKAIDLKIGKLRYQILLSEQKLCNLEKENIAIQTQTLLDSLDFAFIDNIMSDGDACKSSSLLDEKLVDFSELKENISGQSV